RRFEERFEEIEGARSVLRHHIELEDRGPVFPGSRDRHRAETDQGIVQTERIGFRPARTRMNRVFDDLAVHFLPVSRAQGQNGGRDCQRNMDLHSRLVAAKRSSREDSPTSAGGWADTIHPIRRPTALWPQISRQIARRLRARACSPAGMHPHAIAIWKKAGLALLLALGLGLIVSAAARQVVTVGPVTIGDHVAGSFADATGHSAQSHLVYAVNFRTWWVFTLTSTR